MFTRKPSGVLELMATALCLWAAAYHTPMGALVRGAVARVSHSHSSARPLLAYYTGGVYESADVVPASQPGLAPAELAALAAVPEGTALARGVFATLSGAPTKHGVAPRTVDETAQRLAEARAQLGSDEAAVLALFAGDEVARYAVNRAVAEGAPRSLEVLARQLPPGSHAAVEATSKALSLGTAFGLSWPVAPGTRVTSPFGWRNHPTLGKQQLHTGVDLAVAQGTAVKVVADGIVRRASEDAVNGRVVIIDHGRGVSTAYCHNSRLLVAVGERVRAGDTIAESGNTGRSTGAHLHYQLELAHRPTDPMLFRGGQHLLDVADAVRSGTDSPP